MSAMTLSYDEAVARVTAAGERFETAPVDIGGITHTVFKNAPPTLREIFATARQRSDDAIFLVYEDERWSFPDVMRHVDGLGALLVDRYGVTKGDRVAIGMRNYPEWVIAFAAITSIGAISVSLNAWWTEDELDYALDDCGANVLIGDRERVERAAGTCKRLGIARLGVRLDDRDCAGVDRMEEVLPLGTPLPEVDLGPDDDATILYTSGTTANPK
ncbi:MAG: AMP-binding protein, partial [Actinomycetota bacterium]